MGKDGREVVVFFEIEGMYSALEIPEGMMKEEYSREKFEEEAECFVQDVLPFSDDKIKLISKEEYIKQTGDTDYIEEG